jgi:branched-subunit amino acid transport protein
LNSEQALLALVIAAAGTYFWRALGVGFSGRINTESPFFRWMSCVAYAMLAGLVVRIILLPVGLLEQVSIEVRVLSVALAAGIMLWKHPRFGGLVPALTLGCLIVGGARALG